MKRHPSRLKQLSLIAAILSPVFVTSPSHSENWVDLLQGDALNSWTPKFAGQELGLNYKNTFQLQDGSLNVSYNEYDEFKGEFGHLFYNIPYSNYRLRFSYRFTGKQTPGGPRWAFRNSGVMVHSQSPDSMAVKQEFPASIEVQLLGQTSEKKRPTGNVCTPGSHIVLEGSLEKEHCIYSSSATYPGDVWVNAEIEVRGNKSIKHYINGEMVMSYTSPQLDPSDPEVDISNILKDTETQMKSGYIAFQAESHPVEFKNIQLLEIQE